jgi:tetratricopeptide (TPR) repeat protein
MLKFCALSLLPFFLFIVSCSSPRSHKTTKYVSIAHDPIQMESLERLAWNTADLKGYPEALIACYQGKFKEGLEQLRIMTGKEKDPNYWNMVGSCYYWKKDYPKAKFYFELGLSNQDKNQDLLHNLALVELMQGRVHLATKELTKILQTDAYALLPRWNLALIYYSNKSPELALQHLKLLNTAIPNDPLVALLTMKSYIALEDYTNTIQTYSRIPSEYKNFPEFQNVYAYALLKKQSYKEASTIIGQKISDKSLKYDKEFRGALTRLLNQLHQENTKRQVATEAKAEEGGAK